MYKVFIVDDDLLVRTNIKAMIDTYKKDFIVCGEAANGKEALDLLISTNADIVITDIKMPVMDGVNFSLHVKSKYPGIILIILSNYDDFDYVKTTLKNGAMDYILKHTLNAAVLYDILKKSAKFISEQNVLSINNQNTGAVDKGNVQFLCSKLIKEMLSGIYNDDKDDDKELKFRLAMLDIELDLRNMVLAVLEIDDYKKIRNIDSYKTASLIENTVISILKDILTELGSGVAVNIQDERYVILFSFYGGCSMARVNNTIEPFLKRAATAIKQYLNVTVSSCYSTLVHNHQDLQYEYEDCLNTLKTKFYHGKNMILKNRLVKQEPVKTIWLEIEMEKSMVTAINLNNSEEVEHCINNLFNTLIESRADIQSCQMLFNDLFGIINRICRQKELDTKEIYCGISMPFEILARYETAEEFRDYMLQIFGRLVRLNSQMPAGSYSDNIKLSLRYIHEHYCESISLDDISRQIGLNSTYLSKLFKYEVGKGVCEYLNDYRLEKVKSLLTSEGANIKEIILKCGFNNYPYFFKIFKKQTGLTPHEFIKQTRIR